MRYLAKPATNTDNPELKHIVPEEAFDWYDEYCHGHIDRREFMNRLAKLSALGFCFSTLTSALLPDYARAEQVSFNDPDIHATFQTFSSPHGHGSGRGYLVVPNDLTEKRPVVLVVHENRGLNPYIKDVARRLAKAGFIAFAPDALHTLGGYPGNDDEGRVMQKSLKRSHIEQDFIAAGQFIKRHPMGNGKLGAIGFCFGGYIVNMLAGYLSSDLDAGVPFYGTPANEALRERITAPLQLHFAELDQRVNSTWPSYQQDLDGLASHYQAFTYEGVHHGFHNDSTARYAQKEADLAWQRTLLFFQQHLA